MPNDPAEREAVDTARRIVGMSEPAAPAGQADRNTLHRAAAASAPPASTATVAPLGGGAPLPASVRSFMEPRFGADFSTVRIHTSEGAARQSAALGAHAFTLGENIVFGRGQYRPESAGGRELIAHELTHTIQQGAAIQRSADPRIAQTSPPRPQGLFGASSALDYFADKARYIPGFTLLTILIGTNPINRAPVVRSAAGLLRGLLELLPVIGPLIAEALVRHGIFDKAGAWLDARMGKIGLAPSLFEKALDAFLGSIGWRDIADPGGVWERAKRIFTEPIGRLVAFGRSVTGDILVLIRQAVLVPLARLARGTRAYDLLTALLGQDPITGAPVPRNAETLIHGLLKLAGHEEVWENIKQANAIARVNAWFAGAKAGLIALVRGIPGRFRAALAGLDIGDLMQVPGIFARIGGVFFSVAGDFIFWAGRSVFTLLKIVVQAVSPETYAFLKRAGAKLEHALKNFKPFMNNLLRAFDKGFRGFGSHFLTHLKAAVLDWLVGQMPGIYMPKALELGEFLKFGLSVLGLTWENVRAKLVEKAGAPFVTKLETGVNFVQTLISDWPNSVLSLIKDQLTKLKDQILDGIYDMLFDVVVKRALPKILSYFIPGVNIISLILSIYDTAMLIKREISRIMEVANRMYEAVSAVAAGQIDSAASNIEMTLEVLLSLAIKFLANFAKLGTISNKIREVIAKIRQPIDKALGWLVDKLVDLGRKIFAAGKDAIGAIKEWWKQRRKFRTNGEEHQFWFEGGEKNAVPWVASHDPKTVTDKLKQFAKIAAKPGATEDQKRNAPLIATTAAGFKKNPNDEIMFHNLAVLFGTYDFAGTTKAMEVKTTPTSQCGGYMLPTQMRASWINLKEKTGRGTDAKQTAHKDLMDQLVTSGAPSDCKFFRGHLLSKALGGKGDAENLFPITAYANGEHERSTEGALKNWTNVDGHYANYFVDIDKISSNLNGNKNDDANYVNCTITCHTMLMDTAGKTRNDFKSKIKSRYRFRHKASKTYAVKPPESSAKKAKRK